MRAQLVDGSRESDGSAAKVLMVLRTFLHRDTSSSLAELVQATGLPRTTVHRMLGFLVRAGLVAKRGGLYRLGDRSPVVPLPAADRRVLVGCLSELLAVTGETVQVSVLDGNHALVVERLHGRAAELTIAPGSRLPLHCTAPGKILLASRHEPLDCAVFESRTPNTLTRRDAVEAELALVRRRGVAFDHGEWNDSVTGVAVAVHRPHRSLVAALSVHGRTGSFRPEHAATELRRIAHVAALELAR
ncbi:IclR family transcriptional regulator [Lentzea sp. BCCO 10_0798]|uniref:IclR family transcriptional regulator n=1 Tax=Lentzea kristufekii TaxID=3095430 RepID=A0ABU4U1G4_9PSEU|nr:IclR family transcriptional regulator [Lentzea sp. BCCO 10_0798]MDX8054409.1 IclR family transcriptional regulator [Lentzea sp. BCCO 10_0798]